MHREVEQAGGTYALRESSEAYGGEFAQENGARTPKSTIPWQKFAETAETSPGPTPNTGLAVKRWSLRIKSPDPDPDDPDPDHKLKQRLTH